MASNYLDATTDTAWSTAASWSLGTAPVDTEDVAIFDSNVNIAGSNEAGTFTNGMATFDIFHSYTGKIGSIGAGPPSSSFTYLTIEAILSTIGKFTGMLPPLVGGSPRLMLNYSTVATQITVERTSRTSSEGAYGMPPVRILAVNASNILNVWGGSVGVACHTPFEASTFATINIGNKSNDIIGTPPADVVVGAGVTLTTLNVNAGTGRVGCAFTTGNVMGGKLLLTGAGSITTLNVRGASEVIIAKSGGTIGTLTTDEGTKVDTSKSTSLTITNSALAKDSLKFAGSTTFTNPPTSRT